MPIQTARRLVSDALRLRLADSLNNTLSQRVLLMETEKSAAYQSYTNLLNLSEQKFQTQKENTGYMERLALSYKSELEYYQKKDRKHRRQRNLLSYGVAGVIVLLLVK